MRYDYALYSDLLQRKIKILMKNILFINLIVLFFNIIERVRKPRDIVNFAVNNIIQFQCLKCYISLPGIYIYI